MDGMASSLCSAVMIFNLQHICFNQPTLKSYLVYRMKNDYHGH